MQIYTGISLALVHQVWCMYVYMLCWHGACT